MRSSPSWRFSRTMGSNEGSSESGVATAVLRVGDVPMLSKHDLPLPRSAGIRTPRATYSTSPGSATSCFGEKPPAATFRS